MNCARLIEVFAERTVLPVDLNEVRKWLLEKRVQDEINFVRNELDTGVIRGFLRRHLRYRGGWDSEPEQVSNIHYDHRQPAEWINLVCAKELLHILDAATCSTREEFEKLKERLALPNDLQHLLQDPDFALADRFGTAPAAALLLPWAARELLMPAYQANVLTPADIGNLAVMPEEHVRLVMSKAWPSIYSIIVGRNRSQPAKKEPRVRQIGGVDQTTKNRSEPKPKL